MRPMQAFETIETEEERREAGTGTMKRVALILMITLVIGLGVVSHSQRRGVSTKERVGQNSFVGHRPNIIHIFLDDVGLNDLGYENAPYKTPAIDRLANTGMVLEGHRVFPSCSPTRMSFMTGRLPYEFGVTHAGYMTTYELPPEHVLPELLNTAGYRSFGYGKWHSGRASQFSQPTSRGFEVWKGFTPGVITQSNLANEMPWAFFTMAGFTQSDFVNFSQLEPAFGLYAWEENAKIVRKKITKKTWGDDLATDGALEAVDQGCNAHTGTPCFLYLNFGAPHAPIVKAPTNKAQKKRCSGVTRPQRRMYCEMVQKIDGNIKRLVKKLKATGKWKDTMIVISADNGGLPDIAAGNEPYLWDGYGSNLPYRGTKVTVFEGGVKTRAVVNGGYAMRQFCKFSLGAPEADCSDSTKLKALLKANRQANGPVRRKGMMSVQDWFTTYASIGGVKKNLIPAQVDGKNMYQMLFGGMPSPRVEYSVISGRLPSGEIKASALVRDDMKMLWWPATSLFVVKAARMGWRPGATLDGFWNVDVEPSVRTPGDGEGQHMMLFNLTSDPTETKNLYNDPNYLGVQRSLQARMNELQKIYTADPYHMQPQGIYASVNEGYTVVPWVDDPRYNGYPGTLRDAVLYWVDQKHKIKGGQTIMNDIHNIQSEENHVEGHSLNYDHFKEVDGADEKFGKEQPYWF